MENLEHLCCNAKNSPKKGWLTRSKEKASSGCQEEHLLEGLMLPCPFSVVSNQMSMNRRTVVNFLNPTMAESFPGCL